MIVSNGMKKAIMSMAMISAMTGMMMNEPYSRHETQPSTPRPKGYEPQGKSAKRLKKHKAHKKILKARKNARKGIYENKIKYKKKRG